DDSSAEKSQEMNTTPTSTGSRGKSTARAQGTNTDSGPASKRRCVSTACIACRRRKSKCDGNLPSCAACSSVYHTTCVYDPNSDHRRKGVYKKDTDTLRAKHTTLLTLIQALLNYEEDDAFELLRQLRSCDNLEDVAQSILGQGRSSTTTPDDATASGDETLTQADQFESELAGKMSELVLDGSRKFIGGTSNLIFLPPGSELNEFNPTSGGPGLDPLPDCSVTQWTRVTSDERLTSHLMTMYFTWHYPFFTTLSKDLFYRDYVRGVPSQYCSTLLVNAMLALGCHFSDREGAREDPRNSATAGDHFFKEAKRLFFENDEHANAKLCTVQALALLSVREAGCGRETKGWVYSGMSFRMAFDLGLNFDNTSLGARNLSEEEVDARRITFWGCFLFDKCWSNYLGRQPQLGTSSISIPMVDILPNEEAALWSPYMDTGVGLFRLCEINGDLLVFFYDPTPKDKPTSKQAELKKLSEIHTRLESWKKELPKELRPQEGQLPQALLMHMFYQLLLIHLYRPFLKYTKNNSPLPQHVSPRKLCTQAASAISKLLRMYKRTYGFKQICNVAVYMAHTALTVHLLNLPEKNAQRDVIHGLRHLEEMGESWLCARRTLRILEISANKWHVELPREATNTFEQTHAKWGSWGSWDQALSPAPSTDSPPATIVHHTAPTPNNGNYPQPRSLNAQLAHQGARLPEPTYLRPVNNAYNNFQPVPLAQHDIWYGPNEGQIRALSSGQTAPVTTASLPITGFDGPESLVEESQDWWSRESSALHFGMDEWVHGWNSGIPGRAPDMRYGSSCSSVGQTPGPENPSRPQPPPPPSAPPTTQTMRFPVAVPPTTTTPPKPEQHPDTPDYHAMGFPGDFQR
ncbi:nitrogen assimilation transcription factor nirA, partial [Aspergillus ellipticus CBS 707.79]